MNKLRTSQFSGCQQWQGAPALLALRRHPQRQPQRTYRYTGQRQAATGLYFYTARWYDPAIGRFIQPDTLVPGPANPTEPQPLRVPAKIAI